MKFYFLTHMNMADLNENNNSILVQETKETFDTNSTVKKLVNLATSVAIATGLTLGTPAKAETSNFNVATSMANGSIDKSSELSQITQQIQNIENQIKTIEAKNELTTDDKRARYQLKKQIDILDSQRDAIRNNTNHKLDKKVAIIDENIKDKKEQVDIIDKENEKKRDNIKTQINEIKNLISSR